jgi:hypothetical protein
VGFRPNQLSAKWVSAKRGWPELTCWRLRV